MYVCMYVCVRVRIYVYINGMAVPSAMTPFVAEFVFAVWVGCSMGTNSIM